MGAVSKEEGQEYANIKGFLYHGFSVLGKSGKQYYGSCPFCFKDKFYINPLTLQWDCKSGACHLRGNLASFLLRIYENALIETSQEHYRKLEKMRGISWVDLKACGLAYNGEEWLMPVYRLGGDESAAEEPGSAPKGLLDLRHWNPQRENAKVMSTPTGKLGIFNGKELLRPEASKQPVWICEGEWDCIAMRSILRRSKNSGIAISFPGANTCKKFWLGFLENRDIRIAFDNDKAGLEGMNRIFKMIREASLEVKKEQYIRWPSDFKSGYDVRDLCNKFQTKAKSLRNTKKESDHLRVEQLFRTAYTEIMEMMEGEPPVCDGVDKKGFKKRIVDKLEPGFREKLYEDIKPISHGLAFRKFTKFLTMRDDLVLAAVFGAVLANRIQGEPIWLFLVGQPGAGKTEMLMGVSALPESVAVSTLTPRALLSGSPNPLGKDPSLIPRLNEKILIIKDFTTILSMHQTAKDEIFGVLRDAYDGKIEKIFGNGVKRKYESRFGIIAGVTPAIDAFHGMSTSLGERFLKFRMPPPLGKSEQDIIRMALGNIGGENTMRKSIEEICIRAISGKNSLVLPEFSPENITSIVAMAQLCAKLRGGIDRERYTRELSVLPSCEVGTRIAKQLAKMALGVSIYMKSPKVCSTALEVCRKIAVDSIPEKRWKIFRIIFLLAAKDRSSEGHMRRGGLSVKTIAQNTGIPDSTIRYVLEDLLLIRMIREVVPEARKINYLVSGKAMKLLRVSGVRKDLLGHD